MAAAEEQLLKLLDSYWFQHGILSIRKPCTSSSFSTKSVYDHQDFHKLETPAQKLSEMAKFQVRSKSDRCIRCNIGNDPDVASPKSVISFGKENNFSDQSAEIEKSMKKKVSTDGGRRRKGRKGRKGISRSLSELEYEELKGFMDLGFVFTEEDRTSSLVSILPGLQRWGNKDSNDEPVNGNKDRVVSRPYLSEAWNVLNQRKVNKPMANWKIPPLCNENTVKDQLKAWAHSVASYVR
ncbi:OLC1v1023682C1 [Oldenlandia corymbosa var. corymbosa]|uniref:OLC1v1023682C1 n=1 Tax=Oldenlandia corymbosa var. corymbosa TaxID=529605 RepID=A0AAV1C0J1_OLDCO|nr:OLC1v1023682C1 [Oldenlandia corymbosa var. corymbosa]